jgi:transposase-like protein
MNEPIECKRCGFGQCIKNGKVRDDQQRYKCPRCELNFVEGDKRVNKYRDLRTALADFFYKSGASSRDAVRQYFGLSQPLYLRQRKKETKAYLDAQGIKPRRDIRGLTFDEIKAYLEKNRSFLGNAKRWIVAEGEIIPGYEAIVIMRPTRPAKEKDQTVPAEDHNKA